MSDYLMSKIAEATARREARQRELAEHIEAGTLPPPEKLTPTGPGYRSLACPRCKWHTHFIDPAEGDARYRAHYEMVHGL